MFSLEKLTSAFRRLWAPALVFGVVVASGYAMQAIQDPAGEPHITTATR